MKEWLNCNCYLCWFGWTLCEPLFSSTSSASRLLTSAKECSSRQFDGWVRLNSTNKHIKVWNGRPTMRMMLKKKQQCNKTQSETWVGAQFFMLRGPTHQQLAPSNLVPWLSGMQCHRSKWAGRDFHVNTCVNDNLNGYQTKCWCSVAVELSVIFLNSSILQFTLKFECDS